MTACLLWTHFDHLPPSWCLRPQRVNKPRASKFPVTETAWGIRIRGGSGIGPTFAADEGGANVSQRGRAIQKERLLAKEDQEALNWRSCTTSTVCASPERASSATPEV